MCQCPTSPIHSILSVLFSLRSLWPQSRRRVYLRALSWHMCIVNVRPSHFYLKALSHRRFNGATRAFKDDVCSYFKHNSRSKAECRFRYIHTLQVALAKRLYIYIYILYIYINLYSILYMSRRQNQLFTPGAKIQVMASWGALSLCSVWCMFRAFWSPPS